MVTTNQLWGGRFKKPLDESAVRLSYSLESDKRLVFYDLDVNKAHAKALYKAKYLSRDEYKKLTECLDMLAIEFRDKPDSLYGDDEDIHTCIERLVTDRCGDLGKKLHTGKSRNDQVITDTRLYTKDSITSIREELQILIDVLVELAKRYEDVIFPGFTHFQPAQPVLFSHHMLAYVEKFFRDLDRFDAAFKSADVCALGSGALAGNNYNLDRQEMAKSLGFSAITANSMDAVSDRDFIADTLHAGSVCMTHLSRFCEELIIFSSPLVGLLEIGDDFTTGSSLMPQKKNPDVAELIRGKTGRVHGHWVALQTTLKGLPLAYNRDLQEDKVYLFDTVDNISVCLTCFHKMIAGITLNEDAIEAALKKGYGVATDFADYLVEKGVPFREAHDITGAVVLIAIEEGKQLHELSLDKLKTLHPLIDADVFHYITYQAAVSAKSIEGGTAPSSVKKQISKINRRITWKKH
ncbi:MAG: argininosuccinate lyase [Actinobacteria bacterium]|nr:argininosuccinate lyase [Actinomycetota bacterium]